MKRAVLGLRFPGQKCPRRRPVFWDGCGPLLRLFVPESGRVLEPRFRARKPAHDFGFGWFYKGEAGIWA